MATENSNSKVEKEVAKIVGEVFKLLDFDLDLEVKVDENIQVDVQGEDLGLLIGSHGDHLESLQVILGVLINKKLGGEWRSVVVDIGGWRKAREEDLKLLIDREVAKLSPSNKEVELPPMPPSQRRAAHILASNYPDVDSSSEGEEPYRRIVLKRKEDASV